MVVATPELTRAATGQRSSESSAELAQPVVAFMQFVEEVLAIPSVRKAVWVTQDGLADLYVVVEEEDGDDSEQVHLLKREYRQRLGFFPVDVRVISLAHVDERNLPTPSMVFQHQ